MSSTKGVELGTSAAKQFVVGYLRGTLSDGPDDEELVERLIAGPTGGRVHGMPFPDDFEIPAIGFNRYGAVDSTAPIGRGMPTSAATIRLQIRAVCEGYDETPIEEAASILNQLLDGRANTVDLGSTLGAYYVECSRESELVIDLPPEEDETVYQQLGGVYSFYVTRTG
jgi:hypothetical protein